MTTFLVSYDLNRPHQDYPNVVGRLQDIGVATRVLYSTYVVETPMTAADIISHLADGDQDDSYFVVEINQNSSWSERLLRDEADFAFLSRSLGRPTR